MDNNLKLPKGKHKLLLHSCCAPCSGDIILRLKESAIDFSIYILQSKYSSGKRIYD